MNRSNRELGRAGMAPDAGAPRCPDCHQPLRFGTDRNGRTTESCLCGYHAYLETRRGATDDGPEAGSKV